ncbi:hypothetical protein [Agrococcus casei]|uniref:hypothetical protein n=1 Tax=Agrococcus casei TaxID=343512 RepID=UPI001178135F|nr:hypothetical protein [Agrococcus casei]
MSTSNSDERGNTLMSQLPGYSNPEFTAGTQGEATHLEILGGSLRQSAQRVVVGEVRSQSRNPHSGIEQ